MRLNLILLSLALTIGMGYAQKLPKKQDVSMRPPGAVKIDGKATEWGTSLKAYNPATEIFYTMANDDEKLYLVFQVKEKWVINKLVNGGFTMIIQKNGSKKDKDGICVSYPFLEKGKRVSFIQGVKIDATNKNLEQHLLDSAMKANNQKLARAVKWIYTHGMMGLDSLLSVYNSDGIKVANAFDIKKVYTGEMAIDLKLLGMSVNDVSKFSYHILLNGGAKKYKLNFTMTRMSGTNPDGTPMNEAQLAISNINLNNDLIALEATTDFWGEYTLAGKQ